MPHRRRQKPNAMSNYAANAYRRVDLESAPKTQILDRLFERFARDIEDTKRALAAKDIQAKAKAIDHAIAIAVELEAALDHAAAPELAANLASLYRFVVAKLNETNATLAELPLEAAARVMRELADAFRQVHG